MADRVGERFGNYRLVRLLGKGGFADVYLGQHIHLDSFVAVKILFTRMLEHEQEEFLHEARLIASLTHPSIVRVLDCGIEHDTAFLLMNYAPHGTLRQRHHKGTRLPIGEVLSYTRQVTSALHYAHSRRIIHRDVKPENMLLGPHNEILLSDFGIAMISSSSSSQSTQATAGTISYMAPEQVLGKPRLASDQYALGIVLYEWLCGERPFQGSFSELCAQHLYAPPPSLTTKNPLVSPAVQSVVLKALAKQPQDRFPTIQAFMQALEETGQYNRARFSLATDSLPPGASEMISTRPGAEDAIPTVIKSSPTSQDFTVHRETQSDKAFTSPTTPSPYPDYAFVEANQGNSQKETLLAPTSSAHQHSVPGITGITIHPSHNGLDSGTITGAATAAHRRKRTRRGWMYIIPALLIAVALIGASLFFTVQHFSGNAGVTTTTATTSTRGQTAGITPQSSSSPLSHVSPTSTHKVNPGLSVTPTTGKSGSTPTVQATTPVPTKTPPTPVQVSPTISVSPTFRINNFTGCQWDSHGGVGQAPNCPYTISNASNASSALNWSVSSNNPNVKFSASTGTLAPGQSVTITILDLNACPIADTFAFRGNSNTAQASMICTAVVASPDAYTFDNTWCTHSGNWSCVIQVSGDSGNSQNTAWSVSLQTPDSKITFSQNQGTLGPGAGVYVTITIAASDCPGNNQFQFIVPGSLPNGSSWLNWSC